MSLLPADMQGALAQLLQALQSRENNIRSQAEDQLTNEWLANRPDVLLMGLAEQIQLGQDEQVSHYHIDSAGRF
jgi:importin-5